MVLAPSQPKATGKRGLSRKAMKMVEDGIDGTLKDLEGEFPFHLNIIYKEKERKWYVENSGKEYHIKGGQSSLAKIQSAINGSAIANDNRYGTSWDRNRTLLVKDRLAKLLGEKNAIEIVLNVKKFGAMMGVLKGGE